MTNISNDFKLRIATEQDIPMIWPIIQQAILRRKNDGSNQWQDGYPNSETITNDIKKKVGFVGVKNHEIIAYVAIDSAIEPAYEEIEGKWLSDLPYVVIHRVAVSENQLGQGIATKIFYEVEKIALDQNIKSLKVDTNYDNVGMLKILEKINYTYCGEVYFRGSPRRAFEKLLK